MTFWCIVSGGIELGTESEKPVNSSFNVCFNSADAVLDRIHKEENKLNIGKKCRGRNGKF